MDAVDAVVAGAGVVGLAIARQLALAGREVLILEAESTFGSQTSSRNSEVIHAGVYYPTGSLKARLCLEGKELLYHYCAERDIGHRRIGKLLIASEESELPALAGYAKRGAANGVPLQPFSPAEVSGLEPAVRAIAGLYSESTGIVDSHALMLALLGNAEQAGATLVTHTPLTAGRIEPGYCGVHRRRGVLLTQVPCPDQLGGAAGAASGQVHRGLTCCARGSDALRQGALLRAEREVPLQPPRLPNARPCRAGDPRYPQPWGAVQVRTRCQRLA